MNELSHDVCGLCGGRQERGSARSIRRVGEIIIQLFHLIEPHAHSRRGSRV